MKDALIDVVGENAAQNEQLDRAALQQRHLVGLLEPLEAGHALRERDDAPHADLTEIDHVGERAESRVERYAAQVRREARAEHGRELHAQHPRRSRAAARLRRRRARRRPVRRRRLRRRRRRVVRAAAERARARAVRLRWRSLRRRHRLTRTLRAAAQVCLRLRVHDGALEARLQARLVRVHDVLDLVGLLLLELQHLRQKQLVLVGGT